jgi:hypothetical protein
MTLPELMPFALMLFYLIPFLVAAMRNHDLLVPILIANVLLGWTIVGWFLVLFAAMLAPVDGAPARRRS